MSIVVIGYQQLYEEKYDMASPKDSHRQDHTSKLRHFHTRLLQSYTMNHAKFNLTLEICDSTSRNYTQQGSLDRTKRKYQ